MAESLNSFVKVQLDDHLTCSVCLDQYTNPKTLPCHHSFCLDCIQLLPVEIKDGKHCISCPICRVDHLVPQGGAANLPNAFQINSLLDVQKKLAITEQKTIICLKHNDPLKVYCETCCQVICRDCAISKKHNTHDCYLITECYPKHHQKIQDSLDLVKCKRTNINTVVTHLATRKKEMLQQGQQIKEQINTHAQQIIDKVQRSCIQLSQQVDTIVQQKTQVLKAQRRQALKLQTLLENCQKMVEHSLKEWTKQQILTEKCMMMDQMNNATQHVDPAVLQPIETIDLHVEFANTEAWKIEEIGRITSTTYEKAALKTLPCMPNHPSTATLTLQNLPLSTYMLSSQSKSKFTPNHKPIVHDKISAVSDSDDKAHELEELMEELEQLRGELEQKDKQLAKGNDRMAALENQIEEYAGTIVNQNRFESLEIETLRQKCDGWREAAERASEEAEVLRLQVEQVEQERDSLNQELQGLADRLQSSLSDKEACQSRVSDLQKQVKNLQDTRISTEQEISKVQTETTDLSKDLGVATMAEQVALPSVDHFAEELSQEPDWYSLGIFLGAPTQELDTIGLNYSRVSITRCLIELYKCLQSRGKTPSWKLIANNLKRINNHSLAARITSVYITPLPPSSSATSNGAGTFNKALESVKIDVPSAVAKGFFNLKLQFAKLNLCVKTAVVESNVNLSDLQHVIDSFCDMKPLSESEATFESVFGRLGKEHSIFESSILSVIIDTFLHTETSQVLTKQVEEFEKAVDTFKGSTRMGQLVGLINKTSSNSDHQVVVRLKVREFWSHFTIKQFETVINELLGTLYSHLSHMSVVKGCYCISWIIADIDITTASKLIPQHSQEFVKSIGIIYLQIGEEMLYEVNGEKLGCEVLEAAMLQAIELKNTRAIELLLAVGCSPEVATYNEDNAVTNIVNIREKSNDGSVSVGVDYVCILGQNEHIEAIVDPSRETECSSCRLKEKMMKHLQQENDSLFLQNGSLQQKIKKVFEYYVLQEKHDVEFEQYT